MNKKIIIAILTAAAMLLTGCEKEEKDGGVTEATTTVTEVTTEKEPVETTAETEATTAETTVAETEPEIETEIETEVETEVQTEAVTTESKSDADDNFGKASDWNFIGNAKHGDGFITYDSQDISDSIADVGMVEKELSKEEMLNATDKNTVVYKFTIQNAASAGDVNGMYMTTIVREDGFYFAAFGKSDARTLDEILPYCSAGKEVEYWAFGEISDEGIPVLIPFIAGSEESGYYLIIPALEQMNQDVEGLEIPEKILGRDISGEVTTAATTDENKGTDIGAAQKADGSIRLDITEIDNGSLITTVDCAIKNNTGKNIYLTGTKLMINGVDYSDKFTAFIEIGSGETVADEFFIDDATLYNGDKLDISFMVYDNDTYSEIDEITYTLTLGVVE